MTATSSPSPTDTATPTPSATDTPSATTTPTQICADGPPIAQAHLKLSKNGAPIGNERFGLKGEAVLGGELDMFVNTMWLAVLDASGSVIFERTIAAGSAGLGLPGWTLSGGGLVWSFKDRDGVSADGITGIKVLNRSSRSVGLHKFKISGKSANFHVPPASLPLTFVVVFGPEPDQCAQRAFQAESGPEPWCLVAGDGAVIKCR